MLFEVESFVHDVRAAAPQASIDVRMEPGSNGVVLVEIRNTFGPSPQVRLVRDAGFAKVQVGRYVFDLIPVGMLPEFVTQLLRSGFRIEMTRSPEFPFRLVVKTGRRKFDTYGSKAGGEFQPWEWATYVGERKGWFSPAWLAASTVLYLWLMVVNFSSGDPVIVAWSVVGVLVGIVGTVVELRKVKKSRS